MSSMMSRSCIALAAAAAVAVAAAGLVSVPGCRREKTGKEYRTIKGTALSIDEATGKVAMVFVNKKGAELTVEGTVTAKTEILINGRVAQLSEIKTDERVIVTGYIEKDGSRKRMFATKVEVDREGWSRPKSTTGPASKPAGKTTTQSAKP